tara:strand:+ start:22 stop:696 length:675 start_codon:yes stop_codon:yes gene_type:complete
MARRRNRKLQSGGMLVGPSHEQGGIPAVVGGTTPIELEGGEYIVNKETVDEVGIQFFDKLNSTATTYHQGGYKPGKLPAPSRYTRGGRIMEQKRTKPVPTRRKGGSIPKKLTGGKISCPPGQAIMNGMCVSINGKDSYRIGGKVGVNKNKKLKAGGLVTNKNIGTKVKQTRGGPTDKNSHQHTAFIDIYGYGYTDTVNGHSHKIKNHIAVIECPTDIGCHTHEV